MFYYQSLVGLDHVSFTSLLVVNNYIYIENLYSPEIHPVANNMREHREKLN